MRNNKEVIIDKPIFESFEYFAKLRAKLQQFNLFINGEGILRADGIGLHYTFPSNSPYEVANIAKW